MKSHSNLYESICAFENLLQGASKAQRGKRFKASTARFNFFLERELLTLQNELLTQRYRPGAYTTFTIREPKTRLISAAPYRDRVVHHALCNVIEPLFERTFIYDSYACRQAKGTHAAVERFSRFCRQYRDIFKADLAQYFPSIDHDILFAILSRTIRDRRTRWLIRQIIDASNPQPPVLHYFPGDDLFMPITRRKGLPIGNLASQLFANIYLNGFDHFVKETLRCRAYIRYCDDFVVFSDDKQALRAHQPASHRPYGTELARTCGARRYLRLAAARI
jgi:retron-type reverse transcriptase